MPKYRISPTNIHIIDSWAVSKKKFNTILDTIQKENPECSTWKRNRWSLKFEWATHNAFYNLHLLRNYTKDVDLNYPQKWYINWAYNIVGCLVWIFIP